MYLLLHITLYVNKDFVYNILLTYKFKNFRTIIGRGVEEAITAATIAATERRHDVGIDTSAYFFEHRIWEEPRRIARSIAQGARFRANNGKFFG